jgi:hypothetical protein
MLFIAAVGIGAVDDDKVWEDEKNTHGSGKTIYLFTLRVRVERRVQLKVCTCITSYVPSLKPGEDIGCTLLSRPSNSLQHHPFQCASPARLRLVKLDRNSRSVAVGRIVQCACVNAGKAD